jgi:hypothetical protein
MNDLNSVLIEGKISKVSKESLTMKSCRYDKDDNIFETTFVDVETTYIENARINRNVRIVGRLKMNNDKIVIEAEHIEYRPQFDKQENLPFEENPNEKSG